MSREYLVWIDLQGLLDLFEDMSGEHAAVAEALEDAWGLQPDGSSFVGTVTLTGGQAFAEFSRAVQGVVWRTLRRFALMDIRGTLLAPTDHEVGDAAAFEGALERGDLDAECRWCGALVPFGRPCVCVDADKE